MFKRYWWMLLVMVPVGAMVGFLIASVVTYVMPKMYESSAVIEIKPQTGASSPETPPSSKMTPAEFGTEFEITKSRHLLAKVVEGLDLVNRWGTDEEAALHILKRAVSTENIRGTDLIQISVRHPNKVDARDIAAEVARSYREYRTELEEKRFEKGINDLKKAVREQEDKVEDRRKTLISIRRSNGPFLLDGSNLPDPSNLKRQEYLDAKRDFETDMALLEKLKLKLISDEITQELRNETIVIHEDPIISDSPISPNVTLNLVIGLIGGALISPFLAVPLMWVMNRRSAA